MNPIESLIERKFNNIQAAAAVVTKEQLLSELTALQAKINALP